jgi:hypothetical protein
MPFAETGVVLPCGGIVERDDGPRPRYNKLKGSVLSVILNKYGPNLA